MESILTERFVLIGQDTFSNFAVNVTLNHVVSFSLLSKKRVNSFDGVPPDTCFRNRALCL